MRCKYDFSLEVRVFWHLPGNMKSNVFRSKTGPPFILSVGLAATGSLFKDKKFAFASLWAYLAPGLQSQKHWGTPTPPKP